MVDHFKLLQTVERSYELCVEFELTEKQEDQFKEFKTRIANGNENRNFTTDLETGIKSNSLRQALGATLEQQTNECWLTIAFASRFFQ